MRLLVIGLDGFEPTLVQKWIQTGDLSNVNYLIQQGQWGKLETVPNMNSAPAWSTFATGVNPGQHGIYYFTEIVQGTYRMRTINASHRKVGAFWKYLSHLGVRVGVVNVPVSFPAEPVQGFMIAGMDAPSPDHEGFSFPEGFYGEICSRLEYPYCIEPMIHGLMKEKKYDIAMRVIDECISARMQLVREALQLIPVDVLVAVFTAADVAQHFFWGFMEPFHFNCTVDVADEVRDFILYVYKRLDAVVGELMEITSPEGVMILSDHGAGFSQRGRRQIFQWLQNVGLLNKKKLAKKHTRRRERAFRWLQENLGFLRTRKSLRRFWPWFRRLRGFWLGSRSEGTMGHPERLSLIPRLQAVDWQKTKAFCANTADIFLNLKGREPRGQVGLQEAKSLMHEIINLLQNSVDPITKKPVIEWAATAEELYSGGYVYKSPDITIRFKADHPLNGIETPGFPAVVAPPPKDSLPILSGGHRPYGTLIMSGQGILAGGTIRGAHIVDIAPTILYWLDLPIPGHYEGHVLKEAFTAERASVPLITAPEREPEASAGEVSSEEMRLIEERLRDLGYID